MRFLEIGHRQVSVIGLGAWQFGSHGWGWGREFGPAEATAIVRRALDLGITLFDTAEIYARGSSEKILGEALGDRRAEAYIATKFWPLIPLGRRVEPALRRSLQRLRTRKVELYQLHWPNPLWPLELTMRGMKDVCRLGLTSQIGVSNFSLEHWEKADIAFGGPVVSNQVHYNLLERTPERDLIPFAQRTGRVILAYSPLAQGVLSGAYSPANAPGGFRRANRLFFSGNLFRLRPLLDVLREIASTHRVKPAQVALAWTVRLPQVVCIPGAKTIRQVEENAEAAHIVLDDEQIAALDEASQLFRPISTMAGMPQLARRLFFR